MRGFVMVSAVAADTQYAKEIVPITWPRMASYAKDWDMDWLPLMVDRDDPDLTFFNRAPAPMYTGVDYWSIPYRRVLLDLYEGVVFMDADCLIIDPNYDICREVNWNVPLAFTIHQVHGSGSYPNWGVVVTRSRPETKKLHDDIWAMRYEMATHPWLEQAAAMKLLGWDAAWPTCERVADPPFEVGNLGLRWNSMPHDPYIGPMGHPLVVHPSGLPFHEKVITLATQADF